MTFNDATQSSTSEPPPTHPTKKKGRARKTSTVPTRIYSYRCLPPLTEQKRVEDQFYLAHQYRNALVEIELRMRDRMRVVQLAHPQVELALQFYEGAEGAVMNAYLS